VIVRRILPRQLVLIAAGLAILLVSPMVLSSSFVNAAIKMMIAALFALAFSLAMGQAGMLSFGHSAYYGLGAFAALHLMKAVEQHLLMWPTPLIPVVGAAAGLISGIVFGWFATQRSGVYFAMVTLALAELLFTLAPTWDSLFGGESGISTMRMPSWMFSFGNDRHVYYLTLAWVVLSTWCLWAFTRTPMGRLAIAMRENEHRVKFLGFNTHLTRTLVFAISAMFTGVAGALLAVANEATNYTIFSAQASASVVLQTFIGGAGTFFGPALGAAVMTFFARITSDLTRSWLLYQGLIFVFIMLFVPQGLGGLISMHARRSHVKAIRQLALPYLLCALSGLLITVGIVFVVESVYILLSDTYVAERHAAGGALVPYGLLGWKFDPLSPLTWSIPTVFLLAGSALLPLAKRRTEKVWNRALPDSAV
jgi:branched-chain amino acid transport system permease protein